MSAYRSKFRFVFYMLLIGLIYVSLYPRINVPYVPDGGDKMAHVVMYFTLAVPAVLGWPHRRWLMLALMPLIGLGLEVLQILIPGRGFEWADAVANTLGAVMGVAVASLVIRLQSGQTIKIR